MFTRLYHWVMCHLFAAHEFWLHGPDSDWKLHKACKWCTYDEVFSDVREAK